MELTPIRQFCQQLSDTHNNVDFNIDWNGELERAGYYYVVLQKHDTWQEIHQWCTTHIGKEHYTWTGSKFWFDDSQNAMLFTLMWL